MDMQGTPIGSTNQGMKHTSDPERYENSIKEGAGAVASDSLAAESARSGGKFGDNRDSQPLKQSGSSSTFNNTDTSSATTLPPAPYAAEREAKAAWQETSDEARGPSASMGTTGDQQGNGFKAEGRSNADAAPGYSASVVSDPAQTGKPKGKNITEGGFDEGDNQNTSFTSDIGDKNDPGRRAENEFQRTTQSSSGSTAPRQKMGESDNSQYDVLDTDQNL